MGSEKPGGDIPSSETYDGPVPEFFEVLDIFDHAREFLKDSCASFVEDPSKENSDNMGLQATLLARSYGKLVRAYVESDTDVGTRLDSMADLILDEHRQRVADLRKITDGYGAFKHDYLEDGLVEDVSLQGTKPESAKERLVKQLERWSRDAENNDKFVDLAAVAFTNKLQEDVSNLREYVEIMSPVPLTTEEMLRFGGRVVAKHAFDVVKVVGGVMLAEWLLRRKHS